MAMHLRRKALLLITLTAILAVLGDWSGEAMLQNAWRLPAGLLLLGLAYESWMARRAQVSVQLESPAQWYLGRDAAVQLAFSQSLPRALLIEYAPIAPPPFLLDLSIRRVAIPAAATATAEIRATPRRLGQFQWPTMRIRIAGGIGLAWWSSRVSIMHRVCVTPDIMRNQNELRGLSQGGGHVSVVLGAGAELLQLRAYQPGDPLRSIDWKASARRQRLISRDYTDDQHLDVVLLVDAGCGSALRADGLDRFGHYVNIATRLAQFATAQDDAVGLIVFADQPLLALPPGRGVNAVVRIRQAFTQLGGNQILTHESNPLAAAMRVHTLVRQRSLIVLLTDLDDATATSQILQAVHLLLPKHLPFIASLSSVAVEQLAHQAAQQWLDPYHSLAAQQYTEGLTRKAQALRALGAPVLVARPAQLEQALFAAYTNFRQRRRV